MSVVVLGYRSGTADALDRRGLPAYHLVEKVKPEMTGDYRVVGDLEDAQEVLRTLLSEGPAVLDGVVTAHEQGVFTAPLIRSVFEIARGNRDFPAALLFRDKYLQKRALSGVVPTARCERVTRGADYHALAARLGVPFVVKPSNGHSSQGTAIIEDATGLTSYLRAAGRYGDVQLLAESYLDGQEFHVDGLWDGTRVSWSCAGVYLSPPWSAASGTPLGDLIMGTAREGELGAAAHDFAGRVMSALRAAPTVFHLEAFQRAGTGELIFGECAARVPGAKIPETLRHAYGIDLYDAAVAFALGENPEVKDDSMIGTPAGYVLLLQDRTGRRDGAYYREHFDVVDLAMRTGPAAGAAYGQAGYAILADADRDNLRRRLRELMVENAESHRGS